MENKIKEAEKLFPVEYFMWQESKDPESTPYSYASAARDKLLSFLKEALKDYAHTTKINS